MLGVALGAEVLVLRGDRRAGGEEGQFAEIARDVVVAAI